MMSRLLPEFVSRLRASLRRRNRPSQSAPFRRRPRLEALEDRTLLSVQFTPAPLTTPGNRADTALGDLSGFRPVEPYVSVSDNDPGNIAVSQQAGMRVSANDGAGFAGVTSFPGSNGGDTATAYTSDGRLFWVNITSAGLGIQEINPTTGATIGSVHTVDNGGGADDKPFVVADPSIAGSLYVTWTAFLSTGTQVLVRHSTDWGATWSAAVRADSGSDGFVWPAMVTVDTSHFVYVSYHSVLNFTGNNPSNGDGAVFVTRYNSDLTGSLHTTAEPRGFADITYNVQTSPQTRVIPGTQFWIQGAGQAWVLADPARPGNIYVISADSNNFTNDFGDIRINRSTNFGASWSSVGTLFEGSANHTTFFPNAAIDRFGDIVVSWYDNRRGLTNAAGRFKLDVYAKYSTDGGLTWSSDFAVNDQTPNVNTPNGNVFDPDVGAINRFSGPPPTTRIGEYYGIAIWGGTAYVAWNGNSFNGFNNPVGEQVWTKAFAIRGALTVTGTSGNDTITIRNMPTGSQGSDFVEVLVNGQRQYAGLWSALTGITVAGTSGNDTINIEDSAFGVPITVNEGGGTDTVNVSPTAQFLDHIQGNLTIGFGAGVDTLNLFDRNDGFNDTYTMNPNNVTRTASALISYAGQNFVNINGGTGNVTYNINGTEAGWTTTLDTGSGSDTVNVHTTSGTLTVQTTTGTGGGGNDVVNLGNAGSVQGIASPVTILNNPSRDHVNIDDSADGGNRAVTISGGGVTGIAPGAINFTSFSVSTLSVTGGTGNDTFTLTGAPAISGVTVNGGGGANTLTGPNTANTWSITGSNTGTLSGGYSFSNFQNLTGGTANDAFNFSNGASLSGTVSGGGGIDTLNLGASTANLTVNITGANAGNVPGAVGAFAGIANVTTGSGNDAFVFSDGASLSGTVNGGGGTNTLNESAYSTPVTVNLAANTATGTGGIANLQNLIGGSGNNTLIGPNANTVWNLTGSNAGNLNGAIAFTNFANLSGGSAADTFAFADGAGITGNLDGGGGINTLDYLAYTTPVAVDLTVPTATGVGGTVANIGQLRGGQSNDTLNGNAAGTTVFLASPGNDTVTGAGGLNALIGTDAASTWAVTAQNGGTLTFGGNTTTFSGIQILTGGAGNDSFVLSDAVGVDGGINGGGGTNTLDESAYTTGVTVNLVSGTATGVGGTFTGLQNFVGSSGGGNTLLGPNAATTWNITAQNVGTLSSGVSFNGFQNLTGGAGNDTFVFANGVGIDGTLNGGGTNTLNEAAYTAAVTVSLTANTATGVGGTFANLQSFVGGSAGNTLNGPAADTTWNLTGSNAGTLTGGFSFSAFGTLTGGAGNNTFVFGAGATLSGTLTGGGGTNSLDYSAYTASVIVDLQTNFATGVGGLSGTFTNVHGANSSGPGLYNLLIGGGGNTLTGGTNRRNILVAGGAASTLIGGTQDDLLIGGTTAYDTEAGLVTWQAIAAYWAGTDPYATRVSNLETGSGVPLLDPTTVTGNGGGNTMTGSNELALIYTDGADTISGFNAGSAPPVTISP
jgi:hypothetical protein